MSRIQLRSVSKKYGDKYAIHDVDLDIADGEFMVFLGPSGCGKSTLLRTVAGLTESIEGCVVLGDRDLTTSPPRDRDLAMVFQSYALYPHLDVARNIGFPLRTRRWSKKAIAETVATTAATLGLAELLDRRPAELSGGQRQRVALARAMVRQPGAFLMDEPLSNLDAGLRSATRLELIELHKRTGATFLYVTHDQVEAMTMATRIALMNAGRIEQVGTPAELYDYPRSTFAAGFLGSPPMNLLPATVVERAGRIRIQTAGLDVPLGHDGGGVPDLAVTVGIRPESLSLTGDGSGRLVAEVTAIENLGHEGLLHARIGDDTVCARVARSVTTSPGEQVCFTIDPLDIHVFDRATGLRLSWKSGASQESPLRERSTSRVTTSTGASGQ